MQWLYLRRYFEGGMGFRQNSTTGVAVDDEPETIYMVTSGTHYNGHCCFVGLFSAPLPTATTTRLDGGCR